MSSQSQNFVYPVGPSQTPQDPSAPAPPQSRQAAEDARKDRTLAEFLLMLDDYDPLVAIFAVVLALYTQCVA